MEETYGSVAWCMKRKSQLWRELADAEHALIEGKQNETEIVRLNSLIRNLNADTQK